MSLVRWDPIRDMEEIAERVNRYLGNPVLARTLDRRKENLGVPDWVPVADVAETSRAYLVRVELPGLAADQLKVSLDSHVLSIAGERRQEQPEKEARYHRLESAHGCFLRRFALPEDVDEQKLRAEFRDGVLSVHVPKAEHAQPRAIEVKAA